MANPISIKRRIIARLLEITEPLKTSDFGFRKIVRARTPFLLEPIKPALHLVIFPEEKIDQDDRGYTIQFLAMFKIIIDDERDPYDLSDRGEEYLQKAIEDDILQGHPLNSLANKCEYESDQPFTEEALKPAGGTTVNYLIEYRRMRADPYTTY